jgi:hypothetical protein
MSYSNIPIDNILYNLVDADLTATVANNFSNSLVPQNVVIPNTVYYSFTNNTYTVIGLGDGAFGGLITRLTSITLPNSGMFTTIARDSLSNTRISSITIPNSVTNIGITAFFNCTNLTTVNIDPLNSSLASLNDSCFSQCNALTSIKIPVKFNNSSNIIGAAAFRYCSSLSSVYFYNTTIPILSSGAGLEFFSIAPNANAYVLYGVDLTILKARNWFTYYTVFDPIPCFKEDTLILTDKGYRRIQELRKGDLVKTLLNGFLKIDMIGKRNIDHTACFEDRITDQLYKCSHENFKEVFEPLILTGCHSILVDNFASEEQKQKAIKLNKNRLCVTDNKYRLPACLDERTTVYEIPGTYTIYHLALENDDYYMNYGIYANGLLVETCSRRYLKELSGMELID